MPQTTSFTAPLPLTKALGDNPMLTITASIDQNVITATATEIADRNTNSKTYTIKALANGQFEVPDDVNGPLANMLIGVGQRLVQLKQTPQPK